MTLQEQFDNAHVLAETVAETVRLRAENYELKQQVASLEQAASERHETWVRSYDVREYARLRALEEHLRCAADKRAHLFGLHPADTETTFAAGGR